MKIEYIPTNYLVTCEQFRLAVSLRHLEKDQWAITEEYGSHVCLNKDFEWEPEPLPSSRTDAFLARCRFSLEGAKHHITQYIKKERAIREKASYKNQHESS